MACNETLISASPEAVFAVLGDPHAYPRWVLGSSPVLRVDGAWPAVGASFSTRIGAFGRGLVGTTTVLDAVAPAMLELLVCARPLPRGKVRIELRAAGAATRVRLCERPQNPVVSLLAGPLVHEALHLRNAASLARLKALVESAAAAGEGAEDAGEGVEGLEVAR